MPGTTGPRSCATACYPSRCCSCFEPMNRSSSSNSYFIALTGGAVLWLLTMLISDRREAWDSSAYWILTYPLCLVLSGWLAYREPVRPWRWALATMLVQPVVMAVTSGGSFGLLPLGLILFTILALPAVLAAWVGAWLRLRAKHQ